MGKVTKGGDRARQRGVAWQGAELSWGQAKQRGKVTARGAKLQWEGAR